MPRKDHAAMGDAVARLALTSPPAKPARKVSKAKPTHKRAKKAATVATMRMVNGVGFVLDINDVLTKNDRYRLIKMGRRMAQAESQNAKAYKEAVKLAAVKCCGMGVLLLPAVEKWLWRLDIVSVWPTQRHHADGTHTANGDADAPVAMVKDALQYAGIIDDDMRIVVGSEASVYEKGVRRTVAVLRPITAEAHAESVMAVMSVLG